MRYQAAEKLEIIQLVEHSHLSVRRTLDQIGIPHATFYRWYDLYRTGGPKALEDRPSHPGRVWNRIPDEIRGRIVRLARPPSDEMSLPWNSSFRRRSKSTRRGSSFASPIGYAMTEIPVSPQSIDSYIKIGVQGV